MPLVYRVSSVRARRAVYTTRERIIIFGLRETSGFIFFHSLIAPTMFEIHSEFHGVPNPLRAGHHVIIIHGLSTWYII